MYIAKGFSAKGKSCVFLRRRLKWLENTISIEDLLMESRKKKEAKWKRHRSTGVINHEVVEIAK